jgi:hypothetical protein
MNITADIIVELYAKYQLLNYWLSFGITLMVIFGVMSLFRLLGSFDDSTLFGKVIFSIILLTFVSGVVIFARSRYLIEVVLKPEIAKYVVPVGMDIADKVSKEVSEMWGILKGFLTK